MTEQTPSLSNYLHKFDLVPPFFVVAMLSPHARRTFYINFYSVLHSQTASQQCRSVSTKSAIKRGLRATESSIGPRPRTHDRREEKRDRVSTRQDRKDDTIQPKARSGDEFRNGSIQPSIQSPFESSNATRPGSNIHPRIRRYNAAENDESEVAKKRRLAKVIADQGEDMTGQGEKIWDEIRELGDLVSAMHDFEAATMDTPLPTGMLDVARSKVRDINVDINNTSETKARKEKLFYLVRRLSGVDGYISDRIGSSILDVADKTVIVERPGQYFQVVEKGLPLRDESYKGMRTKEGEENEAVSESSDGRRPGQASELRLQSMRPGLRRFREALEEICTQWSKSPDVRSQTSLIEQARRALESTGILYMSGPGFNKLNNRIMDVLNETGTTKYFLKWRYNAVSVLSPKLPDSEIRFPHMSSARAKDVNPTFGQRTKEEEARTKFSPAEDQHSDYPVSIPYTTAASTFLYGTNLVLAALRAKRRKIYHLYVHDRAANRDQATEEIHRLARGAGVPIKQNADIRVLDKMSDKRPHNGIVLETSALPAPPVSSLGPYDDKNALFSVSLQPQSAEDIAVNGAPTAIPTPRQTWRHPLIVMLDGITDPGNLGNILRTAHFYGVDAVAVAKNTCAPLSSAILAKSSSGACEAVRLLSLATPANFVFESAKAGWRVFAAVAPALPGKSSARDVARSLTTAAVAASSPLATHPCILMLGSEGEGLRANLTAKADHLLSIENVARDGDVIDVGVDSLNVSVAGGVLMEAFLRRPVDMKNVSLGQNTSRPKKRTDVTEMDRENEKIALQGGDLGF